MESETIKNSEFSECIFFKLTLEDSYLDYEFNST